jgi:hypothetical protein
MPCGRMTMMMAAVGAAAISAVIGGPPPDPMDKTCTARWIAHAADSGVLATNSVHLGNGFPFGNVASFADGTMDNSTGGARARLRLNIWLATSLSLSLSLSLPSSSYSSSQNNR